MIGYKELILIPQTEKNGTVLSATVSVYDGDEISPEQLVGNYQLNIRDFVQKIEVLLDSYEAYSGDTDYVTAVQEIEQELLNTKVPELYRELHLELFRTIQLAKQIDKVEQGLEALTDIRSNIEKIKDQYAWF